jgi:hypothetical protein
MLPGEKWWAGCSVPSRAAQYMLKTMDVSGPVACFLTPSHPAQLRIALGMLEWNQAVIAIVPDPLTLGILLHCEDFSAEIRAHRLWFGAGENWIASLGQLFEEHPGLPTPSQFIRPILADSAPADRLIGPAQELFANVSVRRSQRIESLFSAALPPLPVLRGRAGEGPDGGESAPATPTPTSPTLPRSIGRGSKRARLCVVCPSRFRLWEDAGSVLAELDFAGTSLDATWLDCDQLLSASPLALAMASAGADAIVAPNLYRSSLPGCTPGHVPWLTWVTTPRIPHAQESSRIDRLLLADPSWQTLAIEAGWEPSQIQVGYWPAVVRSAPATSAPLTIVADTCPLVPPKHVKEYSSHVLLWQHIAHELNSDPFALGTDIHQYLTSRRQQFGISEAGFDRGAFIERLAVPAFQQGVARLLLDEHIPLRLLGSGWDVIEGLCEHYAGTVQSRRQLRQAVNDAGALIHVWPWRHVHPVQTAGRPVATAFGHSRQEFLSTIRTLRGNAPAASQPALSAELIRSALTR